MNFGAQARVSPDNWKCGDVWAATTNVPRSCAGPFSTVNELASNSLDAPDSDEQAECSGERTGQQRDSLTRIRRSRHDEAGASDATVRPRPSRAVPAASR
jgi:hypothetical protein